VHQFHTVTAGAATSITGDTKRDDRHADYEEGELVFRIFSFSHDSITLANSLMQQ
jgi:hypothetical protein